MTVAIVAGVGPGMGRALALGLARDGADVALAARTEKNLDEVAAEVEALGRRVITVPTDITDDDACAALAATTAERLGGVDVLVHNAFVQPPLEPIERASLDTWRHAFDVNLFGAVRTSTAVLPHLRERGGGSIVFIGSMSARRIQRRFGVYAATKAALHTMTQSLALELGPEGIRVNAVVPGYIWGPNLEWWFNHLAERRGVEPQAVYDEVATETALQRLPTAEEVAEAAVFLASERARAITGQALDVNAGHWFH